MRTTHPRASGAQKFRNFIFGVEDSLVSSVGVLSGIALGGVPRETIFLTGVVLIFVEAFSMGAGSYLTERSTDEYLFRERRKGVVGNAMISACIMFAGYFLAGLVPLSPYIIADVPFAFPASVIASLVMLFVLGAWSGSMTQARIIRTGLRMFLIGGMAIAVGMIVSLVVR